MARQSKKLSVKKLKKTLKRKASSRSSKKKLPPPDLSSLSYPAHLTENRIIEELRQTIEKLTIFDSLGKTLTSCLELSEILRLVINKFGTMVGSSHLGLVLIDPNSNEFYYQYPQSTSRTKRSFLIGRGIIGKSLERGKAKLVINPNREEQFDPEVDEAIVKNPSSMICLPILSKGSVLGVLVFLTAPEEEALSQEKLQLIETFSDYLAIAVENAMNYQKVQDLSITDDLTKLYNSRYLPVLLEREIARSKRYKEHLSLVFIDLDDFKQVNDKHGHMAGSALLTEFGGFLYRQIRTTDVGIRYGGDEFVLVLPRTSKLDAIRVVQRAIEDLRCHVFLKNKNLNI